MMKSKWIQFILSITLFISLWGCQAASENKLVMLAGSELRDMEPLLAPIQQKLGVTLEIRYIGTLDGAEQLSSSQADLAWFSHGKYISLLPSAKQQVVVQEKIMLSPVVLGVKTSLAQKWGWENNAQLTWRDILAKSVQGELKFAMANPTSSNSGFTALIGVAAALSASGDALTLETIKHDELKQFFKGQALTAGSSGWLAEQYVVQQNELDGMINYESVLLTLNQGGKLSEKLTLIYPQEGIVTADYPLMLLHQDKQEIYNKLVEALRAPEFQKSLMEQTLRRPAIPQVPLSDKFPPNLLIELPFPNSLEVIDSLLFAYLDEQKTASHAFFVLDVSGSMAGQNLIDLKSALTNLTGVDQTLSGRFARFRNRERITVILFNDQVREVKTFDIDNPEANSQAMTEIRDYTNALQASGGTAIYTALDQAYQSVQAEQATDPNRYYSIVLMSDGENTDGMPKDSFFTDYRQLPPEVQKIKTFTIVFGSANEQTMQEIANVTAGRTFDSRKTSLSVIFKEIRGYQ